MSALSKPPNAAATLRAAKLAKSRQLSEKLTADLLAVFNGWTIGEQYDFDAARKALNGDLQKGDIARAISGVQTFRPNDAALDAHRAAVISLLNAAAQQFASLQSATSVEEVNAIAANPTQAPA